MKTLIKPTCYSDTSTDLCFRTMPNYLYFLKRKDDMLIFKFVFLITSLILYPQPPLLANTDL